MHHWCSLLSKSSLHTTYFGTLVQLKSYFNASICTENTLKQNKVNDNIYEGKSMEEKLKKTFENKMKNDKYPLFADFNTYEKWLPVRDIDGYRKLYKLPYYTNKIDLDFLVKKLEEPKSRRDVKYFAAPGKSGKTSAVLPAFLRSAEKKNGFTHYLYIAFDNNDSRTFTAYPDEPSKIQVRAKNQGADVIYNCVKILLNDEPPPQIEGEGELVSYNIDIRGVIPDRKIKLNELKKMISELSSDDKNAKILIHVDEHRKMCSRSKKKNDPGASFYKSAMKTLAKIPGVTVIATYVYKPDLPYTTNSDVCRASVGLPPFDIERVMKVTKLKDETGNYYYPFKFSFDKKLDREEKRLFATLKLN